MRAAEQTEKLKTFDEEMAKGLKSEDLLLQVLHFRTAALG